MTSSNGFFFYHVFIAIWCSLQWQSWQAGRTEHRDWLFAGLVPKIVHECLPLFVLTLFPAATTAHKEWLLSVFLFCIDSKNILKKFIACYYQCLFQSSNTETKKKLQPDHIQKFHSWLWIIWHFPTYCNIWISLLNYVLGSLFNELGLNYFSIHHLAILIVLLKKQMFLCGHSE